MNTPLANRTNCVKIGIGSRIWRSLGLLLLLTMILTACQPLSLSDIFAQPRTVAAPQDAATAEQTVAEITTQAVAQEAAQDKPTPVESEASATASPPDPVVTSAIATRSFAEETVDPQVPTVAATERLTVSDTMLTEPITTPVPDSEYLPAPRYMLIGPPGYDIDILGAEWRSIGDQWGANYASYTYEQPTAGTQLTQGFLILEEGKSAEDIFGTLPPANYRLLAINQQYGYLGNLRVFGTQSTVGPSFFVLLETAHYLYSVEITYPQEDTLLTLEEFYDSEAANLVDYLLQVSLQKSRMVPQPTPTPLSPDQQDLYASNVDILVTEAEANMYYTTFDIGSGQDLQGTWEAVGDSVVEERGTVCRDFQDRTNADVVLLNFANCAIYVGPTFTLEKLLNNFEKGEAERLETEQNYPADFVVFGIGRAPITFLAFLLDKEFVYQVVLISRSFPSQSTAEAYAGLNDEFVYKILTTNLEKNHRTAGE